MSEIGKADDAEKQGHKEPSLPEAEPDLLQRLEEQAEAFARREQYLKNEIHDLRRRVQAIEGDSGNAPPSEEERFGPFGIFHEDPRDGTYRLAPPLLLAICGAIFGMLLTLV